MYIARFKNSVHTGHNSTHSQPYWQCVISAINAHGRETFIRRLIVGHSSQAPRPLAAHRGGDQEPYDALANTR